MPVPGKQACGAASLFKRLPGITLNGTTRVLKPMKKRIEGFFSIGKRVFDFQSDKESDNMKIVISEKKTGKSFGVDLSKDKDSA
ncbi:MAG: hypothetical protein WC263_04265, partial [Candidatus Micrarchaeia archaeon]